jgi:hypothetical protein
LKFELKIFIFEFLKTNSHTTKGKWKILKKIDFEIWIEIWKKIGLTQREMKKIEVCHDNLKWKKLEILIYELWNEKI